jgi:hypothetical protein
MRAGQCVLDTAEGLLTCLLVKQEIHHMRRFLILTAFFVGATLIAPVATMADDHHDKRYYDRDGRDYHTWNNQEDRAYRVYVQEQHRNYREFNRTKAAQQREYFRWRHDHPDHVLFKLEVR